MNVSLTNQSAFERFVKRFLEATGEEQNKVNREVVHRTGYGADYVRILLMLYADDTYTHRDLVVVSANALHCLEDDELIDPLPEDQSYTDRNGSRRRLTTKGKARTLSIITQLKNVP